MLTKYELEHGQNPSLIALGRTHMEDLQNHFDVAPDGLYFEGIKVIQHNDPIGITMAHDNQRKCPGDIICVIGIEVVP